MQEDKDQKHDKPVNIIIDRKHLTSPTPTSGAALYALGEVKTGYTLYREVPGPTEDEPILNDGTQVELKNGQKFYSSEDTINPGAR
jgi:hypothetical protein